EFVDRIHLFHRRRKAPLLSERRRRQLNERQTAHLRHTRSISRETPSAWAFLTRSQTACGEVISYQRTAAGGAMIVTLPDCRRSSSQTRRRLRAYFSVHTGSRPRAGSSGQRRTGSKPVRARRAILYREGSLIYGTHCKIRGSCRRPAGRSVRP